MARTRIGQFLMNRRCGGWQMREHISTRYDRVCVNHELLARVMVERVDYDAMDRPMPKGIGRTVYPDGTVKCYV